VCIDGRDVRSIALGSLRRYTAYVPHDSVLFEGSIEQNLRVGKPDASADELYCALRSMRLSSFVASLPHGLQQILGPKGCQLSSGQRQRLALARMFLQPRRVAILDEATSCLDVSSENFVIDNLRRQLDGSTLIVISHRISTVLQFKRVLVFAAGRIVYDGDPHTSEFRHNFISDSASSALSS
jgi:ABC-type multidrug transport system fused ATPase/permease subunit